MEEPGKPISLICLYNLGKNSIISYLMLSRGQGWEKKREEKNTHTKISGKIFKHRLWSERSTKKCLNPLLATEQTNSSPGPSPVWPLVIWSVFITRISPLLKHLWLICQAGMGDTYTPGKQKAISCFIAYFGSPLSKKDDRPAALHTSLGSS